MISVSANRTLHHLTHSTVWFEDDILIIVPRQSELLEKVRFSQIEGEMSSLRKIVGNKKVNILAESRKSPLVNAQQEKYVAEKFAEITNKMAIVTSSPIEFCLMKVLFRIKKAPYTSNVFMNENRARLWLQNQQ
jgi:hypothetical protein